MNNMRNKTKRVYMAVQDEYTNLTFFFNICK